MSPADETKEGELLSNSPSFVVDPGGMFCKGMYVRFAEQRPEPDQCSSCTALYRPMSSTQQQPM